MCIVEREGASEGQRERESPSQDLLVASVKSEREGRAGRERGRERERGMSKQTMFQMILITITPDHHSCAVLMHHDMQI